MLTDIHSATVRPVHTSADLVALYRQYLRVLNNRTFDLMTRFVSRRPVHNGHRLTNAEYSQLIKPGATFCADDIVADVTQRTLAARLHIEFPTPSGPATFSASASSGGGVHKVRSRDSDGESLSNSISGIAGHGLLSSPTRDSPRKSGTPRITRLTEHAFYHFDENWRIDRVWSMIEDVSDRGEHRHGSGEYFE